MQVVNRIVLIDDDPICHLISSRMIKKFSSCEVEAFLNPVEALKQLTALAHEKPESLPDVILLDIDMPQMTGWEFLEEFQKLPEDVINKTSVMILSSSINILDVQKSRHYHKVKHFFSKPLSEHMVKMIAAAENGVNGQSLN